MKTPEQLKGTIRSMAAKDWKDILKDLREEPQMYLLWDNYISENRYIGNLEFHEVLDTLEEVAEALNF